MKTVNTRREELLDTIMWLKREVEVIQPVQKTTTASSSKTLEEKQHGKQRK
jgi:hypothetical protein